MSNGIDLSKSGWENPDGFQPRERPEQAPPPDPVCEAAGPDGWACDLPPNHRGNLHKADDGGKGVTWPRDGEFTPAPEPVTVNETQPMTEDRDDWSKLSAIHEIAETASASDRPAQWAVALDKIMAMTRDY